MYGIVSFSFFFFTPQQSGINCDLLSRDLKTRRQNCQLLKEKRKREKRLTDSSDSPDYIINFFLGGEIILFFFSLYYFDINGMRKGEKIFSSDAHLFSKNENCKARICISERKRNTKIVQLKISVYNKFNSSL